MIDVHTHWMSPRHWGEEWTRHWRPVVGADWPEVSEDEFDTAMADGGVTTAIVFGVRASRAGVATPNEHIARFCSERPGRTLGFMSLDLADPDVVEQMDEGVRLGLVGAKLYPVLSDADPLDPALEPVFARAEQAGLVLLWHIGGTASRIGRLAYSRPLIIDEIARRHPDLTQIMAHMGAPWQRDAVAVLRKNPRVFADVSGLWTRPVDGSWALHTAAEYGVDGKLLFGSDYPTFAPRAAVEALRGLAGTDRPGFAPLDPGVVEGIVDRDALVLLGLADRLTARKEPS